MWTIIPKPRRDWGSDDEDPGTPRVQTENTMKRAIFLATTALMMLGAGAKAPAQGADSAMLDKIVATVDDEVILLSAVLQDVELFLMQTGAKVDSTQYRQLMDEALGNMINEKILLAKARRDAVLIGDDELAAALDRHVQGLVQQAGGQATFDRQLAAEGIDLRELRRRLTDPMRDQLMVQRLVEMRTWELEVGEEEARRFFEENRNDPEMLPMRPLAVQLSHIMVMARPSPEMEAEARALWRQALNRLAAGEDFEAVARAISQGPASDSGGDLGWLRLQDIADPALQNALLGLEPGQTAEEVMSATGLHILRLDERDGGNVRLHQIVFPLEISEADQDAARERAREAWKFLNEGGDWNEAVKRYSDDDFTKDANGSLPLIALEQLDDRYRDVVELLEPGEYSTVFKGLRGYQIVRLDERQEPRPFEFDEIKDQLRTELLSRKRVESLDAYLAELEKEVLVQRMGIPDPPKGAGSTP